MHLPYTSHFGEAVGIAAGCVSTALTGLIVSRPLHKRIATVRLGASVWVAAFVLVAPTVVNGIHIAPALRTLLILQTSSTLATVSALLSGPRAFAALAAGGQAVLYELATFVRDSNYELAFAHLFFLGLLVGAHALRTDPPSTAAPPIGFRRFRRDDLVIFIVTVALALVVTNFVFGRLTFNGDEIANSFQADVYGHFRAYAPVPPCPSMFENYWVFRYQGRVFSQYTPGWPLFMAPFQRLHVIWLAGPVMAGITAVGIARLSRRMVLGLGATSESELRLERTAGALGAMFAMLGPSMLLNGGSRFSHTMVCACFAWAL